MTNTDPAGQLVLVISVPDPFGAEPAAISVTDTPGAWVLECPEWVPGADGDCGAGDYGSEDDARAAAYALAAAAIYGEPVGMLSR